MKPVLLFTFCLALLFSCKKEHDYSNTSSFIEVVKQNLRDSVSIEDFRRLDFSNAHISGIPDNHLYYLRVPFVNSPNNEFLALRISFEGKVVKGKFVHIDGKPLQETDSGHISFNGQLKLTSLNRKEVLTSKIIDGYVEAFHTSLALNREQVLPSPYVTLPEVVVVASITNSTGISWSTWVSLMSLLSDFNNYSGQTSEWNISHYWPIGGSSGVNYFGGSNTNSDLSLNYDQTLYRERLPGDMDIPVDYIMSVDFESVLDKNKIDLQKYINCFNAIPDAGAACTIEIFADIPVDNDPNKIFNFQSQSPGHTFIQIKKVNDGKIAMQNIGFYPVTDWKSIMTNAPIEGKFVDNGEHEYNASLKMDITPAQLQTILTQMLYLMNRQYDIDNYNCTDWALDVFNSVRVNKLEIPLYHIPGNIPSVGTQTPNGIYNKLSEMKRTNHPEANHISMGFSKGFVAKSFGPCN